MPRRRRGAGWCVNARRESRVSLLMIGRRRVSAPAPATVRDANTRTTTGRDLIPRTIEVFERKLHPRPLRSRVHLPSATPDAAPPPPPRSAAPPLAGGGRVAGAQQIVALPPRRGWLKTLCPKGTSARRVVAPPLPWPLKAWLKSWSEAPGSRGPLPGSCSSADRRPCSDWHPRSCPSRRTGRKSHGMGAREGDSPAVPGPRRRPRGAVGEVGLFGNAAQIGREADGVGRCSVRARDGESRSAADSGADRRWSRATQAPADDPARWIRRLADRGGWRRDHTDAFSRAPARRLAPASWFPIQPALKHGPRSLTCVRKLAMRDEPKPGYGAQLRANLEPTKGVGRLRQQDGGHGSRTAKECVTTHPPNQPAPENGCAFAATDPYPGRGQQPGLDESRGERFHVNALAHGLVDPKRQGKPQKIARHHANLEKGIGLKFLNRTGACPPWKRSAGGRVQRLEEHRDAAAGPGSPGWPLKTGGPKSRPRLVVLITASGLQGKGSRQNGSETREKDWLEGWARGPSPQPAGLSVDCSKLFPAGRELVVARRPGTDGNAPFGAFPKAEQPTQNCRRRALPLLFVPVRLGRSRSGGRHCQVGSLAGAAHLLKKITQGTELGLDRRGDRRLKYADGYCSGRVALLPRSTEIQPHVAPILSSAPARSVLNTSRKTKTLSRAGSPPGAGVAVPPHPRQPWDSASSHNRPGHRSPLGPREGWGAGWRGRGRQVLLKGAEARGHPRHAKESGGTRRRRAKVGTDCGGRGRRVMSRRRGGERPVAPPARLGRVCCPPRACAMVCPSTCVSSKGHLPLAPLRMAFSSFRAAGKAQVAGAYGAFVGSPCTGRASGAADGGRAASGARWTRAREWCFRQMSRRLVAAFPSLHGPPAGPCWVAGIPLSRWTWLIRKRSLIAQLLLDRRCPPWPGVLRRLAIGAAVEAPRLSEDATWLILPVVICLSQRLSHACLKKLRSWTLGWSIGPQGVCTGRLCPFYRAMRPGLNWSGSPPCCYFEEIRVLKASLRLDTLAWDNITGFRSYCVGLRIGTIRYRPSLNHKRCRTRDRADVAFRTSAAPYEKSKFWVPGSMVARLKLKGIDGRAPPGRGSPRLNLTQHGKLTSSLTTPLPFVHTARRFLPIEWSVKCSIKGDAGGSAADNAEKSTEPYHLEEGEVEQGFRGEPAEGSLSIPLNERHLRLTKLHTMPRWATGAGRIPRTIEVFERKLHPRPLGQGYTCWAPRPTQFSPPPGSLLPPHRWRCGGSPGRADWSPCPPWRGWLKKHFAPRHSRHDEWWLLPPPPPLARGSSRGPRPWLKRTPAGQLPPADRRPCSDWHPSSQKPPFKDGPGASPMEWGPERVTALLCPDPVVTARRCRRSRVVWECSPNRAVNSGPRLNSGRETDSLTRKRMGGRRARSERGTARAGPAADSGADRRWSRATQARRMIPPAGYAASRGPRRVAARPRTRPRGHLRLLAPGQRVPHSTRLEKHGPRSLTCVRSQRATKPVRRKEADWGSSSWLHRRPT
ncbi:hypothetical protein H6P81_016050 [Aristolochia fimbriata]|uniref:Uncharacterized protein n=1 Tax=Aristolochia fimbriata TaxID=158543 RepID=A0AAV7E760_ARIFI|nr:hypothetical protein H6P81_016050 [Aristolochia fimbriata]